MALPFYRSSSGAIVSGLVALVLDCGALQAVENAPVEHVPPKRLSFADYGPNHFETTFWELRPQRLAPKNCYTGVGMPGWPVTGFGSAMRARYSEFDIRFTLKSNSGAETLPLEQASFKQHSPGEWLPGIVSEWDANGIHYRVTFITAPNEPKPIDLYRIEISNTTNATAQSELRVTLDGAPSLETKENLIVDRDKPLIVLDPVVPVERISRPAGVVDPRTTASCSWGPGSPLIDKWKTHRTGWYGMPVEYLLQAAPNQPLQVFVGLSNDPVIHDVNWDIPDAQKDPEILAIYEDPGQEMFVDVEGAVASPPTRAGVGQPRKVLRFLGRDLNEDGYIRVSVRATPACSSPAVLAMLWAFDEGVKVSAEELSAGLEVQPMQRVVNEIYDRSKQEEGASDTVAKARHVIDVGVDPLYGLGEIPYLGKDPTAFALELKYDEELKAGESKSYLLRLPTIDRPEPECYGWLYRPYDTSQSWMRPLAARHPENNAVYGRDVPSGIDPAQFAMNGPQSQQVWQQQLQAARTLDWNEAVKRLTSFWDEFVAKRAKFLVPEQYVENLYKHSLASLNLYRLQLAPTDHEIQMVGPNWYWDACLARDNPYMLMAWEWAGFSEIAHAMWRTWITPSNGLPESRWNLGQWDGGPEHDGLWLSRDGQWSSQGQTLWGLYNHYRINNDLPWLKESYLQIRRGAEWIITAIEREKKRLGDANALGYGTMPMAGPEDGGPGHNYYVNAFTILGLNSAARAADAVGESSDAARWRQEAKNLKKSLDVVMQKGFFRFNDFSGTLPAYPEWYPGPDYLVEKNGEQVATVNPDTAFGTALVWPTQAVAPFDPIMHGWFRNREHQGEATAGLYGWPYIQVGGAISYIHRGEPDRACDWFYAFVNHASGTLEWGEGVSANENSTDIGAGGQMPHGWATGMYIAFLRHLFLMEDGPDTLHLAPATPRHWLAQPSPIGVEHAPSAFGPVTFHLTSDPSNSSIRGDVQLDPERKPRRLIIHVRAHGGRGLESVKVNGTSWDHFIGDAVVIPNPPDRLTIDANYRE